MWPSPTSNLATKNEPPASLPAPLPSAPLSSLSGTAPQPPPPPSDGVNWCSPGFWRNHLAQWPLTTTSGQAISTSTLYKDVISTPTITLSRQGVRQGKTTNPTLLQVSAGH